MLRMGGVSSAYENWFWWHLVCRTFQHVFEGRGYFPGHSEATGGRFPQVGYGSLWFLMFFLVGVVPGLRLTVCDVLLFVGHVAY